MDERLTLTDGRWFLKGDVGYEWQADDAETFVRCRLLVVNGREQHYYVLEVWHPAGLITMDGPESHRLESRELASEDEAARWLMRNVPDVSGDDLPESLREAVSGLRL